MSHVSNSQLLFFSYIFALLSFWPTLSSVTNPCYLNPISFHSLLLNHCGAVSTMVCGAHIHSSSSAEWSLCGKVMRWSTSCKFLLWLPRHLNTSEACTNADFKILRQACIDNYYLPLQGYFLLLSSLLICFQHRYVNRFCRHWDSFHSSSFKLYC